VRRGRGRLKLTWGEAIKRHLKGWNIPRDLCLDRSAWKAAIDVPKKDIYSFKSYSAKTILKSKSSNNMPVLHPRFIGLTLISACSVEI